MSVTPYNMERYNHWRELYAAAEKNTMDRLGNQGVLIEVAAQHPLMEDGRPNEEFEKRLRLGKDIYDKERAKGIPVKIYVPGSLHQDNGVVDEISLSSAGVAFLTELGVAKEDLYGENANMQFKGNQGVYNSSDECYVAVKLFESLNYGRLHCVCSSAQMMRKALSYIQFGILPYFHTVTTDQMYHNYIDEIFKSIPSLIDDGHGLQGNSKAAEEMRRLRNPNYNNQ